MSVSAASAAPVAISRPLRRDDRHPGPRHELSPAAFCARGHPRRRRLLADAEVLASEHVLVRQDGRVSFFHEAFFDYAFARRWMAREETLVEFLLEGEQELFRRAQVRQVLVHLRADQPERFVAEVEALLADHAIRFHIKEVVLALLRALEAPTPAEWQLIERQSLPARTSSTGCGSRCAHGLV